MPSYSPNPFTLDEAHAAAATAGYKPTQLGNRGRFSFNSRACHVGGDNPNGCWATERDGRVYFHCHKHGGAKTERLEAQRRITANLGLPEYLVPGPSNGNGQPYQKREWTYRNATTGENAIQVVERYDGPCWRDDCADRFAHKHPWLRRDEKFQGRPTAGFLLLEHAPSCSDCPEKADSDSGSGGNPCTPCTPCTKTPVSNGSKWGIIAEGETTAEAAVACGWRAFSYQGGAAGAARADYSPVAGMSILVAPDNDRPGARAALTAAIRCLEAGAEEVRLLSTADFTRRGEDLADLNPDRRARAIDGGWFEAPRRLGPLLVERAAHDVNDRCLAATRLPLVTASQWEHFHEHVAQVWAGIFKREDELPTPSLYARDGKLVYLSRGGNSHFAIMEHNGDSVSNLAAESVHWHLGWSETVVAAEPDPDPNRASAAETEAWVAVAEVLDGVLGEENAWLYRQVKERKDAPPAVVYALRTPKKHHPQSGVVKSLLVNLPDDLPQLSAVVTHPFLNGSGDRLVVGEGYYAEEGIYLQYAQRFSPIPVEDAVALLDDLFCDFPFKDRADRANLFAAIVTTICRRSYSIAPMIMFDKPKSGTGATLLAGLVAWLTTGKKAERLTYPSGELLEFEKRVAATCRSASGMVLMDNLSGTLSSSVLADLITADDTYDARMLGFSSNLTFDPKNFVLAGTANNVVMKAELVNRTLPIRLDAGVERPEHRSGFRHPDVKQHLIDNLGRFQNAALSLVHHWLEAGRPPASRLPQGLRRFPAWQRQTAAILEHCGIEGFAENVVEFEDRAVSQEEASIHPFVEWWWETHQSNPVGVKDLAATALGDPDEPDGEGMLVVRGTTDKQRRANLSKMIKGWVDQTFELSGTTVRVTAGPMVKNRYPTWFLQTPDSKVGAFPLLPNDTDVLVQGVQRVQGFPPGPESESAFSGQNRPKRTCRTCGKPLLPDEPGPDCEGHESERSTS